jgi:pyrimidine-nucleoside phosphorylase
MRAVDIIINKRNGERLSAGETDFLIRDYVAGRIPDYQMSAWLMAIYFQGMDFEETADLTRAMLDSGRKIDLGGIPGPFIDKHSTGGVGDKISLILAPLAAACGLKVPSLAGRGLGHTGGTVDKLESIPGYRTSLSGSEIRRVIEATGFVFMGQTGEIAPADRLLYALRDVTGTVESIPLITASILSKKASEGSDGFVFDVKAGMGAFMKTVMDACSLARSLVSTTRVLGKKASALVTAMNEPLGRMVGNLAEVKETVECLSGRMPVDIEELTLELGVRMLSLGGLAATREDGIALCRKRLADGSALAKFLKNIECQGGDPGTIADPSRIALAPQVSAVKAGADGVVQSVDAYAIGRAAVLLGAGRADKESVILPRAGLELLKKTGAMVRKGDDLCLLYAEPGTDTAEARVLAAGAYAIGPDSPEAQSRLILDEMETTCSG